MHNHWLVLLDSSHVYTLSHGAGGGDLGYNWLLPIYLSLLPSKRKSGWKEGLKNYIHHGPHHCHRGLGTGNHSGRLGCHVFVT